MTTTLEQTEKQNKIVIDRLALLADLKASMEISKEFYDRTYLEV
jgi:hypothetical protein